MPICLHSPMDLRLYLNGTYCVKHVAVGLTWLGLIYLLLVLYIVHVFVVEHNIVISHFYVQGK